MVRDPRVAYAANHLPPGGYDSRFETRSLQVKGKASLVTDPDEIAPTVSDPEFAKIAGDYPDGTACTRQPVRPKAVAGLCVAMPRISYDSDTYRGRDKMGA
ncbi:hypothetical protein AB0I94_39130 [Streptomyces sp. NPDC050147]|uniref:hypothetical protein n=1 Tax=Streptomyces sp. NPDC050147 TaxID=3155513 RepID=UPI00341B5F24